MIKRNNKGFTLLELLISIFILTTVIFLGYRVINKSTIDIKNQGNINQGQLTVNDMNEYLTKDLEQARSIALYLDGQEIANTKSDTTEVENNEDNIQQDILKEKIFDLENKLLANDDFYYSYNIKFKDENTQTNKSTGHDVTYKVSITEKNENNYKYIIVRTDGSNGVSITFTNDETVTKKKNESFELPFTIVGNGTYKVNLGYNGKNNEFEKYEFTIASRLNELLQIEPPKLDEVPEIPKEEELPEIPSDVNKDLYQCIGYWTMDNKYYDNKYMKGDLYTWIKYGENTGESYGKQVKNKDKFYISAKNGVNSGNSNNGSTEAYIKDTKSSTQKLTDVILGSVPANQVYKIKIYVSPHTKVEQTKVAFNNNGNNSTEFIGITDETKKEKLQANNGLYKLEGGEEGKWYNVDVKIGSSHKMNFDINGMLSIDKSKVKSGYALIVYGDKSDEGGSSSDLDGDIIFDFYNKLHNNNKIETFANKIQSNIVNSTGEHTVDAWLSNYTEDLRVFIYGHENKMSVSVQGREMSLYNEKFKNITGMVFSVSGNIKLKNFQIEFEPQHGGYKKETIEIELDKSTNTYTFDFLKYLDYANLKVTKLSCKLDVNNMKNFGNIGDEAQIKVDFIYNK